MAQRPDLQKVLDWLLLKKGDVDCPICGDTDAWRISQEYLVAGKNMTPVNGAFVPYILLECQNCAHVMMFEPKILGGPFT